MAAVAGAEAVLAAVMRWVAAQWAVRSAIRWGICSAAVRERVEAIVVEAPGKCHRSRVRRWCTDVSCNWLALEVTMFG